MPKAAAIAISAISMLAAVGLLIAREWVAAGIAIVIAVVFDVLLVRPLVSEIKPRKPS
jgi:hypothetical protein